MITNSILDHMLVEIIVIAVVLINILFIVFLVDCSRRVYHQFKKKGGK